MGAIAVKSLIGLAVVLDDLSIRYPEDPALAGAVFQRVERGGDA